MSRSRSARTTSLTRIGAVLSLTIRERQVSPRHSRWIVSPGVPPSATAYDLDFAISSSVTRACRGRRNAAATGTATAVFSSSRLDNSVIVFPHRAQTRRRILGGQVALWRTQHFKSDHELAYCRGAQERRVEMRVHVPLVVRRAVGRAHVEAHRVREG